MNRIRRGRMIGEEGRREGGWEPRREDGREHRRERGEERVVW